MPVGKPLFATAHVAVGILDLAFARKLASLGASNKLEDECAKAIERYLSDSCKVGIAEAGFAYECPPAP